MKINRATERVIKRTLCMTIKQEPVLTMVIFSIGIIQSLASVGIVAQTTRMVDSITSLLKYKESMIQAAEQVILLCAITILTELLNAFQNLMYEFYINRMRLKYGICLNQKSKRIDPICYEDPKFLDKMEKARGGMESSIEMLLLIGDFLTYYFPYFIFMGIYLFRIQKTFPIFLIAVFAPAVISQLIRMHLFSDMEDKAAPMRRKMQHYRECVSDINYIKETRVLNVVSFFKKKYKEQLKSLNLFQKKTRLRTNVIETGLNCITLAGYLFILIMLFWSLINHSISVGQFAGVYASISTMFGLMDDAVRYNVSYIFENIGIVQNYFSFMDTEEITIENEPEKIDTGISFHNVSFTYPGKNQRALESISFDIKPKETIAIVGANGSGKSTLLNLLLGLYHPTAGSIRVAGEERSPQILRSAGKSAVFQKFQKYKLTAGENIQLSDIDSKKAIDEAVSFAGIENLVQDCGEKILATEFAGVDLSIGQWQRLAIARAVYKDSVLIGLDEPTASIDPIEEDDLYKKFEQLSMSRMSVIVTHHLGSIRFADRILVLDDGKMVGFGTHKALMKESGLYRRMYQAQAEQV